MAKIKVCKNSNEFTNVCVLTDESQTIRYGVIGTKRYILGDRARYYLKINEKTKWNVWCFLSASGEIFYADTKEEILEIAKKYIDKLDKM